MGVALLRPAQKSGVLVAILLGGVVTVGCSTLTYNPESGVIKYRRYFQRLDLDVEVVDWATSHSVRVRTISDPTRSIEMVERGMAVPLKLLAVQ